MLKFWTTLLVCQSTRFDELTTNMYRYSIICRHLTYLWAKNPKEKIRKIEILGTNQIPHFLYINRSVFTS